MSDQQPPDMASHTDNGYDSGNAGFQDAYDGNTPGSETLPATASLRAIDTQQKNEPSMSSPVGTIRSLTDDRRVSVISSSKASARSPAGSPMMTEEDHDETINGIEHEEKNDVGVEEETGHSSHAEPEVNSVHENHLNYDDDNEHGHDETLDFPKPPKSPLLTTHSVSTDGMDDINLSSKEGENDDEDKAHDQTEPNQSNLLPPSLPARESGSRPAGNQEPNGVPSVKQPPPALPPRENTAESTTATSTSTAAAKDVDEKPSLPRPPTIVTPPQPTAPPQRKGPIGWLQRVASREFTFTNSSNNDSKDSHKDNNNNNKSKENDTQTNSSKSSQSRRNTNASASSRDAPNGVDDSRRLSRNTLRDQFYALRMREEGVPPVPAVPGRSESVSAGDGKANGVDDKSAEQIAAAAAVEDEKEAARARSESLASSAPSAASKNDSSNTSGGFMRGRASSTKPTGATNAPAPGSAPSPASSILNPNLPPGTVSGISKSASDASAPVNWELWQTVVNHGPSALKGANAGELNAAIKAGIPQTIRGVIWQVLADSRNPELEEVYRELVARGTDKEYIRTPSFSTTATTASHPASINEKPEDDQQQQKQQQQQNGSTPTGTPAPATNGSGSQSSSMHSGMSTPTNGTNGSHNSPTFSQDGITRSNSDTVTRASVDSANVNNPPKRRTKEEAASLQRLEKAIKRDLGSRTSYSKYFMSQKNQDGLFGVCKAYALFDEAVGYAQGMNFIVMPLLFNMEEGEAFTLMVKLMNEYGMRDMFVQGMPGLHLRLYQFERLLEDLHPALVCHLKRRGVSPLLYATQWFLTLFAYRFPLQLVLRIYDLIFEEGVGSTILRFSVAIMLRNAETLLGMEDMSSLTTFLKEKVFDVYIDQQPSASSILESGFFGSSNGQDKEVYRADLMVQDACNIKLTPKMIETYTKEWEEKTTAEREAAAELDSLRKTANSQAQRIRFLEQQSEKSDKEHVQLVSEIVRLKVENEELQDANESMTVQVRELRVVIDKQQEQIEAKLRKDMDATMQRNSEVHSQNRAMEEQLGEMEKELVETKMKLAELSQNHDTLRQKWNDLRKALD
ncbi:GTPase-activating protein [Ascosphaera atra]|nr:GTPase-activating protein [Ascosphaera atra]